MVKVNSASSFPASLPPKGYKKVTYGYKNEPLPPYNSVRTIENKPNFIDPLDAFNPVRTIGKELNNSLSVDSLLGATGDFGAEDTLKAATALSKLPSIPKAHLIADTLTRGEKSSPGNRNLDIFTPADLRNTSVVKPQPLPAYNPVRTIENKPNFIDPLDAFNPTEGFDILMAATTQSSLPKPPRTSYVDSLDTLSEAHDLAKAPVSHFQEVEANPTKTSESSIPRLDIGLEHTDPILASLYQQAAGRKSSIKQPNILQQISTSIATSIGNLFSKKPLSPPRNNANTRNPETAPLRELSIKQQKTLGKLQQAQSNLGMNNGVLEFA